LAKDGYLPRQLHTRGDRLAFSNGILILAGAACFLIFIYDAKVTSLIQLYIVGVFVSFTLSQTGMVRHWNRHLLTERDPGARQRMMRSRVINAVGAFMSGTVLIVVLATKFLKGAGVCHCRDGGAVHHHGGYPEALLAGAHRARRRRGLR